MEGPALPAEITHARPARPLCLATCRVLSRTTCIMVLTFGWTTILHCMYMVSIDLRDVQARWEALNGKSDARETCQLLRAHSRVPVPRLARDSPCVWVQFVSGALEALC